MPQLGLGLGLHKNSLGLTPLQLLLKYTSAMWHVPKASGQPFPTLEPRTLPNGVSNVGWTQNVSVDKSLLLANITGINTNSANANVVSTISNLFSDRFAWTDTVNGRVVFGNYTQVADVTTDDVFLVGTFATRSDGRLKIGVPKTITTVSSAYDYLKDILIRYQLATPIDTLNSPFTNPLIDLKGNAPLTLQGFAGTTSSGYVGVLCPNGKTVPFLKFDGTNDLGLVSAESAPNPTGQQDFAQLVVFKPDDTSARNWGLTRNTSDLSAQYSLLFNGANELRYYISGGVTAIAVALGTTLQYVIYGRISGRKFLLLNGIEINEAVNTTNIISQPNVQFGCRSSSADGLTKVGFAKGDQGACAFFYDGNNPLDKSKIVEACKKFVAKEYGL